jgi:DNA-3-methyladenine glycosylase I
MDVQQRCGWVNGDELYLRYHDEEWGVPVYDDTRLFEFLILEGAQAGLSWFTILKKRENYRVAFAGFDFYKVAEYSEQDTERLLNNPGIVRNRLKVSAAIGNAQAAQKVCDEFGSLSTYFWRFVDGKPIVNHWSDLSQVPAQTELAAHISRDLRKRGFRFVGPTIIYSFMQATGMVMDHVTSCFRHEALTEHAPSR